MSNSHTHSSPDNYHGNYPRSQQAYRRSPRIQRRPYDHSSGRRHHTSVDRSFSLPHLRYVSRHQGTITPHNYQPMVSNGTNASDLIDNIEFIRLLMSPAIPDNLQGRSSQNRGIPPYYSQSTSELVDDLYEFIRLMIDDEYHHQTGHDFDYQSVASTGGVHSEHSNDTDFDRLMIDEYNNHLTGFDFDYQSMASTGENSNGNNIINLSDSDSVDRLLRSNVTDNLQGLDDLEQYLSGIYDPLDLDVYMDDQKEKEEDVVLGYFKTRTHHVAAPKGVNNATLTEEAADKESDICAICQAEFEHEETIGTLQCGHEYHTDCIKQWLLRKKDCPMCRASVLPFTSTKTIETDSILSWVWE